MRVKLLRSLLLLLVAFFLQGCTHDPALVYPDAETHAERAKDAKVLGEILTAANELELISLDPFSSSAPGGDRIYGFKVTGRQITLNRKEIIELANAVRKGTAKATISAFCFTPRHAIKYHSPNGDATLVICFLCRNARVLGETAGSDFFPILPDIEPVFDRIFSQNGLKKAPLPLPLPDESH